MPIIAEVNWRAGEVVCNTLSLPASWEAAVLALNSTCGSVHFAGGGCIGPQNRLEQGAFAAPAGPDHGNYLARQHLQINVVKHTIGTENMTERFNF